MDERYRDMIKREMKEAGGGERKRRRRGGTEEVIEVSGGVSGANAPELKQRRAQRASPFRAGINGEVWSKRASLERARASESNGGVVSRVGSTVGSVAGTVIEVDSDDSDDFEDIDLQGSAKDNDDDDSDFENVDIEPNEGSPQNSAPQDEFTISIARPAPPAASKKRVTTISKEERVQRRHMHQYCVALMAVHGAIRNRWCNDTLLAEQLKALVAPSTLQLLQQDRDESVLTTVRSRRFLDGLQKVLKVFGSRFRASGEGIKRKNWHELRQNQPTRLRNLTLDKFRHLVSELRGTRDVGAQGFVCLLRGLGLNARLVFSLQPPDFTSITRDPKTAKPNDVEESNSSNDVKEEVSGRRQLLQNLRSKPTAVKTETDELGDSAYPVFWAEVWNKYSKRWISIDPVVLRVLETTPMRNKSKFEPPMSEPRNQATYVLAYDRRGNVKDVTRRYTQYYNAKTVKKRISYRSEEGQEWYEKLLRGLSAVRKTNRVDILESKEFYDRDLAEGMPNNIADYNNHPLYALESQLKLNEVIYPKDSTSKCGTFRPKTKKGSASVIPVYKRSHVHVVRSAKAWYMRGRVLKVGVQPLKMKEKKDKAVEQQEQDEDDSQTRLYAEFQTQMYIAPPIVDGKVPKNAYGNIDVYTKTMMPEGGVLVECTDKYPMKMVEYAARSILDIDYAKAIVAFDFGKQSKVVKGLGRTPAAREGGVVVDRQYEEAMLVVLEALKEEEQQKLRNMVRINSLKHWKFLLTKLRIESRLNTRHGKVGDEREPPKRELTDHEKPQDDASSQSESDQYSVYDDTSGSELEEGGFFAGDEPLETERRNRQPELIDSVSPAEFHDESADITNVELESGGFTRDSTVDPSEGYPSGVLSRGSTRESSIEPGGFIVEPSEPQDFTGDGRFNRDSSTEPGGFLVEPSEPQEHEKGGFNRDSYESDEEIPEGGFFMESANGADMGSMGEQASQREKIPVSPESVEEVDANFKTVSKFDSAHSSAGASAKLENANSRTVDFSANHDKHGGNAAAANLMSVESDVQYNDFELDDNQLPDEYFKRDEFGNLLYAPDASIESAQPSETSDVALSPSDGAQNSSTSSQKEISDQSQTSATRLDPLEQEALREEESNFGFQYSDSE